VRRSRSLGMAAAVALIASLLVACSGSESEPSASLQVSSWTTSDGGSHIFDGGITVAIPSGMPADSKISVGPAPQEASDAVGTIATHVQKVVPQAGGDAGPQLIGEAFSIEASPDLSGTATLSVKLPDGSVSLHDLIYLATYETDTKIWTPVGGTYDAASSTVSTSVSHFSIWGVFSWASSRIADIVRALAEGAFAPGLLPVDRIECPHPASDATLNIDASGAGYWTCLTRLDDGSLQLQVRNARSYSIGLELPSYASANVDASGLTAAARKLMGALIGERMAVVPSGATATIALDIPPGRKAVVIASPDSLSYLLDVMDLGIKVLFAMFGSNEAGSLVNNLDKLYSTGKCSAAVAMATPPEQLSMATVKTLAKMGFECIGALAAGSLGAVLSTVVSIATGLIAGIVVGVKAMSSYLSGTAEARLQVQDLLKPVCSTPAFAALVGGGAHVRGNPDCEGSWAIVVWLKPGETLVGAGLFEASGSTWRLVVKVDATGEAPTFALISCLEGYGVPPELAKKWGWTTQPEYPDPACPPALH